jgi:hypothetical protein
MDQRHNNGRPRSVDSILMGIKALTMEVIHKHQFQDPEVQQFLHRILSTYGHGSKYARGIYLEKVKEVEAEIRRKEIVG